MQFGSLIAAEYRAKWERTIIGGSYVLHWKRINVTLDRVTFVLVRRETPGGSKLG